MITASNIQLHEGIPFSEYLKLPGVSFSSIKPYGGPIEETPRMKLGKLVHTYLMTPKFYTWEQPEIVIPIARQLTRFVYPLMQPEIPLTCNLEHEGFSMPYRGVADLPLKGYLVIDIKIINGDLDSYMKRFGYIEQVRGYMLPWDAGLGMIAAWNKVKKRVETCSFIQDHSWWSNQIKTRGEIIKTQILC